MDYDKKTISKGKSVPLEDNNFGEGCTLFKGKIYLMTYHEGNLFTYDEDLKLLNTGRMPEEF